MMTFATVISLIGLLFFATTTHAARELHHHHHHHPSPPTPPPAPVWWYLKPEWDAIPSGSPVTYNKRQASLLDCQLAAQKAQANIFAWNTVTHGCFGSGGNTFGGAANVNFTSGCRSERCMNCPAPAPAPIADD